LNEAVHGLHTRRAITDTVGLLTLYTGILLPWLGGTFWLIFAESSFNKDSKANLFRQSGYGFFLGYAVLFLAIVTSNEVTGDVYWPYLMVFVLLFAVSGAIAVRLVSRQPDKRQKNTEDALSGPAKALLAFAMLLMAIHVTFAAVEIFTQPLYPWDAWLTWVYRAKAWFLANGMVDMTSPAGWATAASADVYALGAWNYPLFASVIPYWAALSLGHWSETLINVPVLFAGLAMAMALYGQCREHGLSVAASLVGSYLFLSIPLLGTHLALAGYADIWMAGFTGLGFVALLRGLLIPDDAGGSMFQRVLGLLMITFGAWVKNEGVVWLLSAMLVLMLVTCRPRVPILFTVAAAVVVLLAYSLGFTYVEIPLFGGLGYVDGHLALPLIGNFKLELHDIRHAYWENFFKMGSWNLLWLGVAGGLLLAVQLSGSSEARRTRRTALSFILVFIATQSFIFGFTNKGMWANTYTAINRLPLQFTLALLFMIMVIAHASMKQAGPQPNIRNEAA